MCKPDHCLFSLALVQRESMSTILNLLERESMSPFFYLVHIKIMSLVQSVCMSPFFTLVKREPMSPFLPLSTFLTLVQTGPVYSSLKRI